MNRFKPCTKSCQGSLTIETAIIFSAVFLMLVSLIYVSILMYEYAYLQSVASRAAQRGAAIYTDKGRDMFTGGIYVKDMTDRDPYSNLFNSDKDVREGRIANYINSQISAFSVLKADKPLITVESRNYVLYRVLNVSVMKEYKLPGGKLLTAFGLGPSFKITARAEAMVNNPAEFIRDTDFITETVSDIVSNTGEKTTGSEVKSGITKFLSKIKSLWKK